MLPPRREERAHGQRPIAAARGDRAGALVGAGEAPQLCPSPRLSTLEHRNDGGLRLTGRQAVGNSRSRDQGFATWPARRRLQGCRGANSITASRFRITIARSVRASSKRYSTLTHRAWPGAPCPFPSPPAASRVRLKSHDFRPVRRRPSPARTHSRSWPAAPRRPRPSSPAGPGPPGWSRRARSGRRARCRRSGPAPAPRSG